MTNSRPSPAPASARRRGRPPGKRDAHERREQLLDAAIRIIGQHGLAAATTRAIAEQAGMTQAMLHYSFPGKQALLNAVLERVHASTRTALQAATQDVPNLDAALQALMREYWRHVCADRLLQKVQYELTLAALRPGGDAELARRQYQGYVAMLHSVLAECAPAETSQVSLQCLAGTAVALMDGLILQLLAGEDEDAVQARLQAGLSMLRHQWTEGH
ncbi:TetR/AcrR family transcriptional regulator [Algiphilus sp.]|uniref:TetR/AcrR family transcriptional regulator n=1 Tax=Algiphilus sp. TaxID=1872431 RepID=UPI003BACF3AA